MRRVTAAVLGVASLSTLGCGRLFCIDQNQCWGEEWDVEPGWDTAGQRDPNALGIVDAGSECFGDGVRVFAVTEGQTWSGALELWEGEPTGEVRIEGHPMEYLTDDGFTFFADISLRTVGRDEGWVSGATTWVDCAAGMDDITVFVRADGDFERGWCATWGPHAEALAAELDCLLF